ncbi:MAG TPA: carboxypeptidase regulatory-like domain-containing protein [Terracidiphilus sp.]|nr:carboxypeptidase regulatory-like domain-containing protein [Terracidiphilus sp.]
MLAQNWTKPLVYLALLMIAGAVAVRCACAQQGLSNGALAGTLTDIRSAPLENMTVTLRNAVTGAAVQTTTTRAGRYRFTGLIQGEYVLTASGPSGTGKVDGIFIAAGHEAHVQTAIALAPSAARFMDGNMAASSHLKIQKQDSVQVSSKLITSVDEAGSSLRPPISKSATSVPAPATPKPSPAAFPHPVSHPLPTSASSISESPAPKPPFHASVAIAAKPIPAEALSAGTLARAVQAVRLGATHACLLQARTGPAAQVAALQTASVPQTSQTLDSAQLQALPLSGRDWQSFVLDVPAQVEAGERRGPSAASAIAPQLTVDGVRLQSAFGSTSAGRTRDSAASLLGPGSSESALRDVQSGDLAGKASAYAGPSHTIVETQRGSDHLHGQAFVFDRQNVWNARNPFTEWVHETAPATNTTVPVFTAESYSPGDHEALWGAGIGGVVHKLHLFWFAALDGYERNDPGVATVKHPDNFFAQPSNDRMQLLSAQLGLNSADPVSAGLGAYSKLLETLNGLLGPAPRNSSQWIGFGRIDGSVAERHHFTFEATGAQLNSPGGGFTRASETSGTHSFGNVQATKQWVLGRWEAFLTPNLLAVTQGSYGLDVQTAQPETPSAFEQSLNINAWGQLPQVVVDSRYGFTIGNPARFGPGSYPDEHLTMAQEQLNWVRGNLLVKAGIEINHNRDATSRLRNQTGTYYYSSVEDFASDALAFSAYGLKGQLDPMNQHNCDQTGKAWRDGSGVLHGLGYLPCYSFYSQTMGPSDWWLSTNDWAGYATSQWQPSRQTVLTLAMRWELEQLPPAISNLENPDLPLTARMPNLGSQWGPRAGFAWGTGEGGSPVIRLGYGVYFSRTRNSVVENALTQTGSLKGDLNFFMRPTDNLNAGGAPPFPYVFAGEPASIVKPAAVEFAPNFRNGEIQQAEAAVEEMLPGRIHLEASAVASLGRRLPITVDANVDPAQDAKTITYAVIDGNASGPIKSPLITVPFFAAWPSITSPTGFAGRLNPKYQQVSEMFSRANSTYEAAMLRVSRNARGLTLRARYTYAHAMDWNPDETSQVGGPSVLDPIDFRQEYGTSALDVRHSATAALIVQSPWKLKNLAGHIANGWSLSGTAYFRSGLPYTMHTAGSMAKEFNSTGAAIVALSTGMNGYGGDNRVYGVGRNTYRYPTTWKADLRLGKRFNLGQMRQLELMAESFNLFNHQNVTELETTGYSIESGTVTGGLPRLNFLTGLKTGQTEFGKPLNINATNFYRERQVQFGARLRF